MLTICLFWVLQSSCATRTSRPEYEDSNIQWEEKTPKQILDQLQSEQKRITDFSAAFSILLDPPPKGQPSNLQGVLFFAANKKGPFVRIKSVSIFGRIMFDLVQKNDFVQIYIPSRQTLYSGRIKKEEGNAWQKLFTNLFADMTLLAAQKNSDLEINKNSVALPLTDGTLHLDRKTGLVQKWVQEKNVIYYEDYLSIPGQPPFPIHIFLRATDNSTKATCVFNQVQINKGVGQVFDLSGYHPKFKRDIKELK